MTNSERIYVSLCVIFTSLVILGNLTYQKFIVLQTPFHSFELSVGAVLYPLTFLITDLIAEFYQKERAAFCIKLAMGVNIVVAMIIAFMDWLPATAWSKITDEIFHTMFGFFCTAFAGSIIACCIAQAVDVYLYLWIRKMTRGKYLWLRSNGSTCVSLFIDTTVVIGFMALFGVLPGEQTWPLVGNSYAWKLFFTIFNTPLFYGSVSAIKYLSSRNLHQDAPI